MTGDLDTIRLAAIEMGIIDEIFKFLKTSPQFSESLLQNVVWLICNLLFLNREHKKVSSLSRES